MAQRTRRRPRVVWLPNTNANSLPLVAGPNVTSDSTSQIFIVGSTPLTSVTGEIPIVIDSEDDPTAATTSLSDIENSGYRLRRIVGKIFLGVQQSSLSSATQAVVTAGLIIRRTNPQDGTSFAFHTSQGLINPQLIENSGDPWVWRRTWLLHNNGNQPALIGPETNYGVNAASALDGPHVDAKTARIVSNEERLLLNVSVTPITGDPNDQDLFNVSVIADLRVLASMRLSSGNRRNASR